MRLREGGFSFRDIAERLGRNVSTVHDCWEQWSKDNTAGSRPGSGKPRCTTNREDHRIQRTSIVHSTSSAAGIRVALRASHAIACIPLTTSHCRSKPELIRGGNGDLMCFLMKAGSALVPVMAMYYSEGGQNPHNTMNFHLELWSGEQLPIYDSMGTLVVIPNTLTSNLYVILLI
ncbi:uncharacterized protein TNCV_2624991 [Trichonephila clavipes]|nr:uncharacterized protein TNCV_2624991 [Trichonephila clavipes]